MAELREHNGRTFAVQFIYSLSNDAWCVELSEAVPNASAKADTPGSPDFLPGPAFLVAFVPDEDPSLEPFVCVGFKQQTDIPYDVMRWFMDHVAEEVERCRAAMAAQAEPEE